MCDGDRTVIIAGHDVEESARDGLSRRTRTWSPGVARRATANAGIDVETFDETSGATTPKPTVPSPREPFGSSVARDEG